MDQPRGLPSEAVCTSSDAVDAAMFSREVEDAAECFSWSPCLLARWLETSRLPGDVNGALGLLASGLPVQEVEERLAHKGWGSGIRTLPSNVMRIVAAGPTPNEIRRRVMEALMQDVEQAPAERGSDSWRAA